MADVDRYGGLFELHEAECARLLDLFQRQESGDFRYCRPMIRS